MYWWMGSLAKAAHQESYLNGAVAPEYNSQQVLVNRSASKLPTRKGVSNVFSAVPSVLLSIVTIIDEGLPDRPFTSTSTTWLASLKLTICSRTRKLF